jgi:hypothetical protein
MATLLDDAIELPVVGRVGIDPLVGIAPVAGDSVMAICGLYIVLEAYLAGVPRQTLVWMVVNVGLDWAIGSLPVLGTIFDIVYRANQRNVRLMEQALSS